ncbi:hypothetical protein DTO027I6_9914 [Penicillium roqueforti]|nr:hypothetical protein CBS147337_10006 [Penicillium roqueforti]KAI3184750.1 hypothetical protein DTO027I6_9914 [Penicillium roqueforti]KAJ5046850.1 hypothetical protein NUH16_008864 [Penicillium rubens]
MMRKFITIAAFAAGTNALNRIGDNSLSPAQYCIDSKGAITDSNGRGCILTPPTTQFQCDEGASPTPGFSLSSEGGLEYNDSKDFVACATGQNGGMNVYSNPNKSDVTGCMKVELTADSCSSLGSGFGSSSSSISAVPSSLGSSSAQSTPSAPVSESTPNSGSGSPAPVPTGSVPVPSAPSESRLSGSPIIVVNTVTVTDCSCSATAPAGGDDSNGSGSFQSASPVPSSGGGCQSSGYGSTSVPANSASATPSATETSSGSCPTTLTTGSYEYPHLIIPVDSSSPDTAVGTSFNGTVSSTISSVFNFDIPSSDSGKTCSLVFLFPKLQELETSSYSFIGDGKIGFAKLSSAVDESTTFNNLPSVSQDLDDITVSPGNSYVVSTFSCPAGETVAYEMKNSGSTDLNFFEDYNPSPLGLYITTC